MLFLSIVHHYFLWHYSKAFMEMFHVWLNFLWFIVNFFSIPQLLRSLFSPWKRIIESRGEKWDLEDFAAYYLIGFFSRMIGFIMRTAIICVGLIALLLTTVGGFAAYAFWVAAPLALVLLLGFGLTLLIF